MNLNNIKKDIHNERIKKAIIAINSLTHRDKDLSDKLHSIKSDYQEFSELGGYFLKKDQHEAKIKNVKERLLQLVEELEVKYAQKVPKKSKKKNYSKVMFFFISLLLVGVSFLYYSGTGELFEDDDSDYVMNEHPPNKKGQSDVKLPQSTHEPPKKTDKEVPKPDSSLTPLIDESPEDVETLEARDGDLTKVDTLFEMEDVVDSLSERIDELTKTAFTFEYLDTIEGTDRMQASASDENNDSKSNLSITLWITKESNSANNVRELNKIIQSHSENNCNLTYDTPEGKYVRLTLDCSELEYVYKILAMYAEGKLDQFNIEIIDFKSKTISSTEINKIIEKMIEKIIENNVSGLREVQSFFKFKSEYHKKFYSFISELESLTKEDFRGLVSRENFRSERKAILEEAIEKILSLDENAIHQLNMGKLNEIL